MRHDDPSPGMVLFNAQRLLTQHGRPVISGERCRLTLQKTGESVIYLCASCFFFAEGWLTGPDNMAIGMCTITWPRCVVMQFPQSVVPLSQCRI